MAHAGLALAVDQNTPLVGDRAAEPRRELAVLRVAHRAIFGPASAALASVDTTPPSDTTVDNSDDSDNTGLWGLLGLLGLAGLAGLKRRTVEQPRYERTHTTV